MKTTDVNTNLIESYFTLLKGLRPNNKLELIAKLLTLIRTSKKTKDISWKSLFGALAIDQSADDFVEDLKKTENSAVILLTFKKVSFRRKHLCLFLEREIWPRNRNWWSWFWKLRGVWNNNCRAKIGRWKKHP